MCANVMAHRVLVRKGVMDGVLMTFNGRPPVFRSVDAQGFDYRGMPLDTGMAQVQAAILRQEGIALPVSSLGKIKTALVSSYLLSSAVCIVAAKGQSGLEYHLVTKSREVLSGLYPELSPSVRKKGLGYYSDRVATKPEELARGRFKVVRILRGSDGVELYKDEIGARHAVHVLPYYSAANYAAALSHFLHQHKVELSFDLDGALQKMATTLDTSVCARWLGVSNAEANFTQVQDWASPLTLGYLDMPNLLRQGEFVPVPLLHVLGMMPYA